MSDFHRRRAFSLVELLVAISIMSLLLALMGAAVSAARSSGSKQKTASTIGMIDTILQQHYTSVESSRTAAAGPVADRAAALRRVVTADMPDSWNEVRHMKTNPGMFDSARQRGYVAFLDTAKPTDQFGDAECLFMIVMQGGLADCLACSALDKAKIGDKDQDGALEFWDDWDEPIRYVLWPAGFELPIGTKFFSAVPPFSGAVAAGETAGLMRPLIFSGGPSKLSSTEVHAGSYLALGNFCGDPANVTISKLGGLAGTVERRADNITNFDGELKR
jgi:prepilin-type N-terminal cleavage/methylation domain-containing protein